LLRRKIDSRCHWEWTITTPHLRVRRDVQRWMSGRAAFEPPLPVSGLIQTTSGLPQAVPSRDGRRPLASEPVTGGALREALQRNHAASRLPRRLSRCRANSRRWTLVQVWSLNLSIRLPRPRRGASVTIAAVSRRCSCKQSIVSLSFCSFYGLAVAPIQWQPTSL
jgi:hypothetical protein